MKQTVLQRLFPAVRAEMLRLLFTKDNNELYTRELARCSFLALRTVQDELANLEAANLIVSRSDGYKRFYRGNPKHPLYGVLQKLVRKGAKQAGPTPRLLPSRRRKRHQRRRSG